MSFTRTLDPAKQKKHSPSDENINWDTEQVLTDLNQVTPGTRINWSEFAQNHGINAKSGGQIVK